MQQEKARGSIDIMHEDSLVKALLKTSANRKETAKLLGITERTVYHMMNKYNLAIVRDKSGVKSLQKRLGDIND
jgi:transcriptional regulator of acetoin/glycerol metabolism